MMITSRYLAVGSLPLLLLAAQACSGSKRSPAIPVPAALASAAELPVSGRQGWAPGENVGFGAYRTEAVRSSALMMRVAQAGNARERTRTQYMHFMVAEGTERVASVDCRSEAWDRTAEGPLESSRLAWLTSSTRSTSRLECGVLLHEGREEWDLLVARDSADVLSGGVQGANGRFHLRPLGGRNGPELRFNPVALVFVEDSHEVGMVELTGSGKVRLQPELPPNVRVALASAALALLLSDGPPLFPLRDLR